MKLLLFLNIQNKCSKISLEMLTTSILYTSNFISSKAFILSPRIIQQTVHTLNESAFTCLMIYINYLRLKMPHQVNENKFLVENPSPEPELHLTIALLIKCCKCHMCYRHKSRYKSEYTKKKHEYSQYFTI